MLPGRYGCSMSQLGSRIAGADGNILVIHLPTRFTDEWIAHIRHEVESRLPPIDGAALVLDFSAVTLVNSLGITCLLNLEERCRLAGASMALAGVRPVTLEFLKRVKLDRRFLQLATVDDAILRFEN